MKKTKRILIPTSSGGHLNEVLELKPIFNKYDCLVITEDVPINRSILNEYNFKLIRPNGKNRNFTFWKNLIINIFHAFTIIIKFKPYAIITTGSHTAVPFCFIGKLFGCKIIYISSFCRTNSRALSADLIYPITDLFLAQWEDVQKYYKKSIYAGQIF